VHLKNKMMLDNTLSPELSVNVRQAQHFEMQDIVAAVHGNLIFSSRT